METKVKVGDKAPDFTLPDTDKKPRSLKEFLGQKVVLAFFVGAFTATCTKEMCEFRDSMSRLTDLEAQVVGVSVNDPFSNKAFVEKNRLPFPVLSDYNRDVVRKYGLELSDFAGLKGYTVAKRSIFILDMNGTVMYVWVSDDPAVEPNYQEIQRALEKIM
ncbi:MAG TPA: redoxin domain-containing protein [Candidatus Bathyarchaeia archaeon]|nr:redoxin domain-containing protein [Candidatus Bathyarchaeia archaeon]